MQTAAMVLESRSDPVCYQVGIDETEYIQLISSPSALRFSGTTSSVTVTVDNIGTVVYTNGPPAVWGDPGRAPIGTRNVQRRTGGNIFASGAVATVALLLRAETRYIRFGGWGDRWGGGIMTLYSAGNQYGYNPNPGYTGLVAVSSSLTGMSDRLNDPWFTMVEGQVVIGSGRGGGPGTLQLKTGLQQLAFLHNPCRIQMTSPNGVLWNVTPGAGGALTAAPA